MVWCGVCNKNVASYDARMYAKLICKGCSRESIHYYVFYICAAAVQCHLNSAYVYFIYFFCC